MIPLIKRKLNDGREFNIVKVFYQPAELEDKLRKTGWQITVAETPHYFLYGQAEQANPLYQF